MYQDETLKCRDCGNEFVFTAGEQEFYASRGFENKPSRCKECRAAKKNAQKGTKGVKIDMSSDALVLNLYLMVQYGHAIPEVAENAQKAVVSAVEAMTGCSVTAVNIHVGGVTLA